jgi:hypothetical protein
MRIEDRGHGSGLMRSASIRCACGVSVGDPILHAAWHARQSASPNGTASKAARQRELQRRARAMRSAEDWRIYFRGMRALNQKRNALSELGLELTGDPDAFRR